MRNVTSILFHLCIRRLLKALSPHLPAVMNALRFYKSSEYHRNRTVFTCFHHCIIQYENSYLVEPFFKFLIFWSYVCCLLSSNCEAVHVHAVKACRE